jgi:hypothetical protein
LSCINICEFRPFQLRSNIVVLDKSSFREICLREICKRKVAVCYRTGDKITVSQIGPGKRTPMKRRLAERSALKFSVDKPEAGNFSPTEIDAFRENTGRETPFRTPSCRRNPGAKEAEIDPISALWSEREPAID